ncbi:acetyl-CoA synthetase [Rivularia sp. IAM M-261]|nr:acetyl-CoA synthetase [Rivularia sp. IAM M-261]
MVRQSTLISRLIEDCNSFDAPYQLILINYFTEGASMRSIQMTSEKACNILREEHHPLDAIFAPKTIAVIGASDRENSVGHTVLWNLISNPFGGTVFPVNPKHHSVLGIKTYPQVGAIPEAVDLAIIATPALTVPSIISECADSGVKGAIILPAGFKETGKIGASLEQQILEQVHRGKMRLIGPNCLGVINTHIGLNATFASSMALPGKVGFISQSGALCTAILDWSFRENVGFSSFISIGSMLDVGWGDLIYYLSEDPTTESILIYMESIGDARSFLSAAREVALTKPIIVIKAGRTEAGASSATSHTEALTGSDAVFDAALRRCGVLRVNSISDLFDMAEVLAKQPRPKGSRLTIITNAGGPGVLATDTLITDGGKLAELSEQTCDALNQILPASNHSNPIDLLGDADPTRYTQALEIAAKDPSSDGLLVILTPQAMTNPTQTARQLKPYAQIGKPVLASWMGDTDVQAGAEILNQASIPTFAFPDTAAKIFNYMWRYSYNLQALYETPILSFCTDIDTCSRILAQNIIQKARLDGRTLLTEVESKQVLAAYNIPVVETYIATSPQQAVQLANQIGYPVVLKIFSETITHKTDIDGVHLNLQNASSVEEAYNQIQAGARDFLGVTVQPMVDLTNSYELILGSSIDPQFGPVLLFGYGGQLVEVFQDTALGLPPLNTTLARRMMEQTHIYKALKGVRGRKPINIELLEQILVQFSQLVVEQPWIQEIDINPLLAKPGITQHSLIALDARIVLHDLNKNQTQLPKPAIRPYPTQYVSNWTMNNGTSVVIRPIRPEDEPLMVQFHKTLSEESVYFRYFHLIKLSQRITHERLTRICFIDYDREMVLVADYQNPITQQHEILAVGRLTKVDGANTAEFAMLVSDRFQCQGLGTELLKRLLQIGRDERLKGIFADILIENIGMQKICDKLRFQKHSQCQNSIVQFGINFE